MKKMLRKIPLLLMSVVILVVLISTTANVFATTTPYYTYTTDNENGLYRTYDAYTPANQITEIDGIPFRTLEYVYVDQEDYIYVTDSGFAKVFVFDKDLNYVDEIAYQGNADQGIPAFFGVNSIYVTNDKVYIPDSFAKAIFIFDRDQVLHRKKDYTLWMEDVDLDDEISNGDLVYEADPQTGEPINNPVYEIELQGTTDDGKNIIGYKDVTSGELLFTKIEKDEMFGKLFSWVTTSYLGKTLDKLSIFAEKLEPLDVIMTPDAPVFQEGYTFAPRRVVVDTRGNMYIVGAQSDNGLIMLNDEGEFLTFFGGNSLRTPLIDKLRSLLLSDVQKEKLREQSGIYIDYVSGVAIDEKGFIYTVTSTLSRGNIKKFNVSGKNYFNTGAPGWVGAVDLRVGAYGNIIDVEEYGWINEYDSEGHLIFSFSIASQGIKRDGLLALPKSIAIDSRDRLYVVDQGNGLLQTYEPTEFTNSVHRAFSAYQDGNEELAAENWRYSLEYSTIFDTAHEGLGDALVRQENYSGALKEYTLASYRDGISDTYWQVRQDWMEKHLDTVILLLILFFVLKWIFDLFNKKYHFTKGIENFFQYLRKKSPTLDEMSYIPTFIKHPIDGYYEIKRKKRVSVKTATIIYLLLALVYVMYKKVTNIIFLDNPNENVAYRLIILIVILSLWVIANYFVCLIRDGEGSFKDVYVATAMSFTPLLYVVPIVTLLSNILTYQEAVFYSVPLTITFIWVAIYFFFMIKEIHNYEVSETFNIIFVSMFTMLIMGIFLFVIYSLNTQIFRVTLEISRELLER
jgi:ABC-type phosphate/phosphonate transport system permease subunit